METKFIPHFSVPNSAHTQTLDMGGFPHTFREKCTQNDLFLSLCKVKMIFCEKQATHKIERKTINETSKFLKDS
jgi:hypothetical protein